MMKEIDSTQNILENLPCGVFRVSVGFNPKFIYYNQNFREMLNFESKALSELSLADIFENRKDFRVFWKKAVDEGRAVNFAANIGGVGGNYKLCSLSGFPLKAKAEKAHYLDVIVEDLSQKDKFERNLIESKGLFQTVFNNTAAAITVTDKYEKIVAWNPFAEQLLGMKQEDLFNKPVKDLYPNSEWTKLRKLNVRQKGVLSSIETQMYKKGGAIIDVDLSISILKDSEGNIIGSIGIIRDISRQKEAQRLIRDSENKIRILLDNSAASIIMTDAEERIVSLNKFTEELLQYTKEDLHLKPISFIYPEDEWKRIRSERIRDLGSKHHLETKVRRKDGLVIDVDVSINILKDSESRIIGSVGIMQDITEQKNLREMLIQAKLAAEQANAAKSMFLANMSHEVRTPMNTIMGMLDLTIDMELGAEQKENIKVAKEAADNLLGLINDILDLSRVESGKIVLENIEFHLPAIINNVCRGLQVIAQKKKLGVVARIDPSVAELVAGDPVRLRQILINLVNNAIKFSDKGDIVVDVAVENKIKDKAVLRFSVIDQGIGIPKDKQEVIFEVFTQAEASTTRRYGGTGLGLAISKRLCEMMGGTIWVESDVGKGSKFVFTAEFRVIKQKAGNDDGSRESENFDKMFEGLKGIKILLAEDNIVNQRMTAKLLQKYGFEVDAVDDGVKVIDLIKTKNFEMILMDAHMPNMDGFEATRRIREEEKATGKHMPIIALTASAMEEDRKRCLDAGMDGYSSKPIDRHKLFEEIKTQIKKGRK
ncbi:MAG: PAS domain S-box protein [Candidatus Omnitrophica bacterium]|nr:PAS domain S-box protein [Candidatus Omnitrophota bacterium]